MNPFACSGGAAAKVAARSTDGGCSGRQPLDMLSYSMLKMTSATSVYPVDASVPPPRCFGLREP